MWIVATGPHHRTQSCAIAAREGWIARVCDHGGAFKRIEAGPWRFLRSQPLSRTDPAAVRRDVPLLESKHLVRTRKVPNPGHETLTLVERAAASIGKCVSARCMPNIPAERMESP